MEEWFTGFKIPIGQWAKQFSDFATDNFEWFFDAITVGLKVPMEGTVAMLTYIPPIIFIVLMAAIAYGLQRNWRLVVFVVLG